MEKIDGYEHLGFICATTLFLTINKCKALFASMGKKFYRIAVWFEIRSIGSHTQLSLQKARFENEINKI